MAELDSLIAPDKELVSVSRGIKVLSELAWEPKQQNSFIANWQCDKLTLPDVRYARLITRNKWSSLSQSPKERPPLIID